MRARLESKIYRYISSHFRFLLDWFCALRRRWYDGSYLGHIEVWDTPNHGIRVEIIDKQCGDAGIPWPVSDSSSSDKNQIKSDGALMFSDTVCLARSQNPAVANTETNCCARVVMVSDTHTYHRSLTELPEGEFLIHCGDVLYESSAMEFDSGVKAIRDFNDWIGGFNHKYKVADLRCHTL